MVCNLKDGFFAAAMEEGAIEGIPPTDEIEEEQTFTVHEEEEEELEEEDGEEKTGVDTVANASSSSEHSHQLVSCRYRFILIGATK